MNTQTNTKVQVTITYRGDKGQLTTSSGSYDSIHTMAQQIDLFIGAKNVVNIEFVESPFGIKNY